MSERQRNSLNSPRHVPIHLLPGRGRCSKRTCLDRLRPPRGGGDSDTHGVGRIMEGFSKGSGEDSPSGAAGRPRRRPTPRLTAHPAISTSSRGGANTHRERLTRRGYGSATKPMTSRPTIDREIRKTQPSSRYKSPIEKSSLDSRHTRVLVCARKNKIQCAPGRGVRAASSTS